MRCKPTSCGQNPMLQGEIRPVPECRAMIAASTTLDLRTLPEREQPLALIALLDDLAPGGVIELHAGESPEFLLQRVNVKLRGALAWELDHSAEGWRARVRRSEDTPPRDVLDLLQRDYHRLDALLGRALRQLNAGDVAAAEPLLVAFAQGLRRHLHAEDEILVHALTGDALPALETMLREHRALLEQLAAVESGLRDVPGGAQPEAWELEPFVALLTGTLAKHEHREENAVLPAWAVRHAALAEEAAAALLRQVEDVLYAP